MGTIINGIAITPWKGRSLRIGDMPDPGPRNYYEEMPGDNWYLILDGDDAHGIYDPALTYNYIDPNLYDWGEKYGIYDNTIGGWNIDYTENTKYQTALCTGSMLFPDGERYKCPQEVKDLGLLAFDQSVMTIDFTIPEDIRNKEGKYSDIKYIILGGFGNSEGPQLRIALSGDYLHIQRNQDGTWWGERTYRVDKTDLNKRCLLNFRLTRVYTNQVEVLFLMRNTEEPAASQDMAFTTFYVDTLARLDRVFWGNGYANSSSDRAIEGFWGIFHYSAFSTRGWADELTN